MTSSERRPEQQLFGNILAVWTQPYTRGDRNQRFLIFSFYIAVRLILVVDPLMAWLTKWVDKNFFRICNPQSAQQAGFFWTIFESFSTVDYSEIVDG